MPCHESASSLEPNGSEADSKKYLRIVLNKESGLQEELQRRLNEYERRMEYQAPEAYPAVTYKMDILRVLLENESVDEEEIVRKEQKRDPEWFDEEAFHQAFEAISRYSRASKKGKRGGTERRAA